jgi:hypothetical protein
MKCLLLKVAMLIQNTLNETFAGNMGQTIQALSQQLGVSIPNPYTGTNTPILLLCKIRGLNM